MNKLICFAVLVAAASVAVAGTARTRIDPATIAIDDTGSATQVVPVTSDAGWRFVKAVVRSASANDRYDKSLIDDFAMGSASAAGFELTPRMERLRRPGNYRLLIDLTSVQLGSDAAATATTEVDTAAVIVTIPAASLDVPAPAVVEIHYLPWIHEWVDVKPVRLHGGARMSLTGLAWYASRGTVDGKPADGALAAQLPDKIGVDGSADATVTATDFERGTTVGTLEISANELPAPVRLTYSVTRRMCGLVVGILFLIGGILGWLVRVRSTNLLRHALLCGEGDKRLAALRDLAARVEVTDRSKVETAITELIAAAKNQSDDDLQKRIVEADAVIATSMAALTVSIARLRTELEALVAVEHAGDITPALSAACAALRSQIDAATAAIQSNHAADAARVVDDARATLAGAATADAGQLRAMKVALDALSTAFLHAPNGLETNWGNSLSGASEAITRVTGGATPVTIAQMSEQLRAVHDGIALGCKRLGSFARDATTALGKASLASEINRASTITLDDDLAVAVRQLPLAIESIYAAIYEAARDSGKLPDVQPLLEKRDLIGAVRALALAVPLGGDIIPPPPESITQQQYRLAMAKHALPPSVTPSLFQPPLLDGRTRSRSLLASRIQKAFSFVVLPLVAWVTYGPTFFGSGAECLVIFGIGFTTNFSIEAVVGAFDKLSKAPAPSSPAAG